MVKKDKVKRGGTIKTWISVVEGYRPTPGSAPKQRVIKSFGYLEDQEDPEAFMEMVKEFNINYKQEKMPVRIEASGTARMYCQENRKQNYGYKFLEAVYNLLGINGFVEEHARAKKFRGEYSPSEVFKYLVMARLLSPDSKRATCQLKDSFYGMNNEFTLADIYRSLDMFAQMETPLQRHLNEQVKGRIGRDLSHAFYDVTNYYFEIDFPKSGEDIRQRGVSKEHRVDPIAAMGLFMDSNGLPVSMSIFPGNTSDSVTLHPAMKDVKASYGLGRLVVVADKGLNSTKNIETLLNAGDGYVFSQILRGTKGKRYRAGVMDPEGWVWNEAKTYRYKLFDESYTVRDAGGMKQTRLRRVLLYWNEAEEKMARRKREEKLERASARVGNNAYSIKKGADEYTREDIVDRETGEVLKHTKRLRSVDFDKAEEDALYDGYFCIVTSELGYDEQKIRQVYGGLWRIEESFRMLKSDLYARPVFLSKNEHIRAHFLICFVALLVMRILQHYMGRDAISAERISRALNAATCRVLRGGMVCLDDVGGAIAFQSKLDKDGNRVESLAFSDQDEIALDYKLLQDVFGTDCYNLYHRQEVFNKFLNSIVVS